MPHRSIEISQFGFSVIRKMRRIALALAADHSVALGILARLDVGLGIDPAAGPH